MTALTAPLPYRKPTPESEQVEFRVRVSKEELGTPLEILPGEMDQYDDGKLYELVNGKLVEQRMSDYANFVANAVNKKFIAWAEPIGAGESFVETTFQCFPADPDLVRRPDVAFISAERLKGYSWRNSHVTLVPDLAVEVLSPNDKNGEINAKLREYHTAGVKVVWHVDPDARHVIVRPNGGKPLLLTEEDELTGGEVLPGFSCRVSTLFPARPPVGAVDEPAAVAATAAASA